MKKSTTHGLLDVVAIPEDISEIGIEAGCEGAVVDILPDGTLVIDVVNEDGSTVDMIDLDPGPPPNRGALAFGRGLGSRPTIYRTRQHN